jgi:WD40 repeat protein
MGGIDHSTPANANSKSNSQKQGFIVAGDNGKIRVFVKSDTDVRMPYKRVEGEDLTPSSEHEKENKILFTDVMYHKAINISLSPKEDSIIFSTDSAQIIKVDINLERPYTEQKYNYLVSSFHSKTIDGLDICIKKQLFATCGADRTVRVWSYKDNFSLDICRTFDEPA